MTRLLVSVRSAGEAQAALAGGADLIDVKEPRLGSLGAASPEVWREVATAVNGARPLSAALGELLDYQPLETNALRGYRYAKLGLAGCKQLPDWRKRWQVALASLPQEVRAVAVIYADDKALAPAAEDVLHSGYELGCRTLLVDTFRKQHGDVFDVLGMERLESLIAAARQRTMQVVLAGSLRLPRLSQAAELAPDYVAVRGAVCHSSRAGALDEQLVKCWSESLISHARNARCIG